MTRPEPPRSRQRRGEDTPTEPVRRIAGTVAVIGYPNVGKSTLINRLVGGRDAVVHATPGVTRDRKQLVCEWNGALIELLDTGGIDTASDDPLSRQVREQAQRAIAQADLVLFVVDAQAGAASGDHDIARILRRSTVPVLLVANKVDQPSREAIMVAELYELGLGEPFPVSALHGHGSGDLLDRVLELLAAAGAGRDERVSDEIGVAILGRPNVGKSSLLNALTGQPRVVVADTPGTTRDSIDTLLDHDGRVLRLIDTAGLRRKRRHRQEVEFYSQQRSLAAASRADVALVLVDASEGLTEPDLHVADAARAAGCATIIIVSKWDLARLDLDETRARLQTKLRQRPLVVATSARSGRGLKNLLGVIGEVFERYTSRLATPDVNRVLADAQARNQPALIRGRRLKLLYGAQVQTRPPRFRITVNDRRLLRADYAYYIENQLRDAAGLASCPVIIDFVAR